MILSIITNMNLPVKIKFKALEIYLFPKIILISNAKAILIKMFLFKSYLKNLILDQTLDIKPDVIDPVVDENGEPIVDPNSPNIVE